MTTDALNSIYAHGLSEDEFAVVGRIIIEFASIEKNLAIALELYGEVTPYNLSDRARDFGKVIRRVGDEGAQFFAAEFSWAMKATAVARNLLAHGLLLYPESGPPELYREDLEQSLAMPDVLDCLPLAHYANYCLQYLIWHRLDIKAHKPFPNRPVKL